ncbi:MAG: TIR domain-containing protein [Sphingomicrobium sp.]
MKHEHEVSANGSTTLTVFLSYDRDDERTARMLVDALEREGLSIWWDGLIDAGVAYADRIQEALSQADVVVVLWSESSARSHWVRDEAAFGRDHNCLVPVSIDGAKPPLGFRQIQSIALDNWQGAADSGQVEQLCRSIRALAGTPARTPIAAVTRGPLVSRRTALVGAGSVGAAAALGGAGFYWLSGGDPAKAARIAVLPFENLSGDPAQDYFSDGLAEELRATLSQAEQLEVAAQTSSESFRDAKMTARAMAHALNVSYLIEGSVRRSPDAIRVSARIVNGRTGFDKWSGTFNRKASDALAVQSDIAASVTDALVAGLNRDRPSTRIGGTRNAQAFDAFLLGTAAYRQAAGKATDLEALKQFDRAVAIDRAYAAAYAARSRTLTVIANNYADSAGIPALYHRAISAARSAIQLAPQLAEGYSALGFVLFNGELDAKGASAPYQRSFELGYGNAEILSAYANFAGRTGRFDDGRKAIARAQSLDRLNPSVFRNAGYLEYSARDFSAAEGQFRTALSMNPKSSNVHAALGDIAFLRGDFNSARTHFAQEVDRASRLRGLAIVDMKTGQTNLAEGSYAGLIKEGGDTVHYQQAQVLAQWGRKDQSLTQLERALALRDAGLVRLRNDPLLDPLRTDERFVRLEQAIGFA